MKYSEKNIINLVVDIFKENKIIKSVFSKPTNKNISKKINIKPIKIKQNIYFQFENFNDNKVVHVNLNLEETIKKLETLFLEFNQIFIVSTENEIQILRKKDFFNVLTKAKENTVQNFSHDNKKNYILNDSVAIPFLIKLGVMTDTGKIIKEKYSKFKQINKYLEFIEITINELQSKKMIINNTMKIVDFGCGKSYLTFALYHYLRNMKNINVEIFGLDLKKDVVEHCNKIAEELEYKNLKFLHGDIKDFDILKNVDLIFSLHACNTATDYSLLKGLELNANAILAVPCCQSEINQKIDKSASTPLKENLTPFTEHGILQEKFSSLATDALRALALELCGYNVKVMEFIDLEHTPKNILIKAIKSKISDEKLKEKRNEYNKYINFIGIEPIIDKILKSYFKI